MSIDYSEMRGDNHIHPHHEDSELDVSTINIFNEKPIDIFDSEEIHVNLNFSSDNGDILSVQQKFVRICASVFITMEIESSSYLAKILSFIFKSVIVISVISYLVSSEPYLRYTPEVCPHPVCDNDLQLCPNRMICSPEKDKLFDIIENFIIAVFTVDYLSRVLTCWAVSPRVCGILPRDWDKHHKKEDPQPSYNIFLHMFKYVIKKGNIVDFISIFPFYVNLIFETVLDWNTIAFGKANSFLILIRILRLFNALDFIDQVAVVSEIIFETCRQSGPALCVFTYYAFIMIILFSALIFLTEQGVYTVNADYPNGAYLRVSPYDVSLEISPFTSIPVSMYFVIITCTTVGYGDLSPTSVGGRCIGSLCAFLGIVGIAFPVGVLGSDFKRVYDSHYMRVHKLHVEKRKRRALETETNINELNKINGSTHGVVPQIKVNKDITLKKLNSNKHLSQKIEKITDLIKIIIADHENSTKATNEKIDRLMNEVLSLEEHQHHHHDDEVPKVYVRRNLSISQFFQKTEENENENKVTNLKNEVGIKNRHSSSNIFSLRNSFQGHKIAFPSMPHNTPTVSEKTLSKSDVGVTSNNDLLHQTSVNLQNIEGNNAFIKEVSSSSLQVSCQNTSLNSSGISIESPTIDDKTVLLSSSI